MPKCGPTFSLTEKAGFLRVHVPDGTVSGDYDNWTGADFAPTFERSDMGSGDWTITTRVSFDAAPLADTYHAGLMFAFGPAASNDVVYWGEYTANGTLAVERAGTAIRPLYTADLGPVSLQVEKIGAEYHFRHRSDDAQPWVEDLVDSAQFASAQPVTRVGLIVKTWGGTASPDALADFDRFCLAVPGVVLPAGVVSDPIAILTPVSSLSCTRKPDGSAVLSWQTCPGSSGAIVVKIAGETVKTLAADATGVTIAPPMPGGSIANVVLDNGFQPPTSCTLTRDLVNICDEFNTDPLSGGAWTFRTPHTLPTGPTLSVTDNPGFLRFFVPSGGGNFFDNWTGADFAPSLERYDMGPRDWAISTRLSYPEETGAPAGEHHVGLTFAYGLGDPTDAFNDVTYWGEYANSNSLRVERTGSALTGLFPYEGAPVSLQVQKAGSAFTFSHRAQDTDDWTNDATVNFTQPFAANPASPPAGTPVSRVGLLIKTWGGSPDVTADFDYFCLVVKDSPPEPKIDANPQSGAVPLEVNFSAASSVDPSGGTMTFKWDFGDGGTATGVNVKHTYTTAGIVTVTLTATDDEKNPGTSTLDLYLSDDASPFALARLGTQGLNGIVRVDRSGPEPSYCLSAGGVTIALGVDQAFFLQKKLTGDFKLSARVTEGDFTKARAKAGLMARLTLDADSPNAMMLLDGADDGYTFQYRAQTGKSTTRAIATADPARTALPAWVRLERQGSVFIGSYSSDGATYKEYGRQDLPNLNVADLLVGFAATSGDARVSARYCTEMSFEEGPPPGGFHRGDSDDNGQLQLTDAVRILGFLFLGGVSPTCLDAADTDDNGQLQLTDAVRILGFLFLGGVAPAAPGPPPNPCGEDTGAAHLGCASYTHC
jgi:regulation of enolase protein 1 (concanavalin A-like superfamily)